MTRCLVDCSIFRLAVDPFRKCYCQTQYVVAHQVSVRTSKAKWILDRFIAAKAHMAKDRLASSSDFQIRLAKLSWVEGYGISTRRYLILCPRGEYDYLTGRGRLVGETAEEIDGVVFTDREPVDISHAFRRLCGKQSEEYCMTAFYASSALIAKESWDRVEDFLRPLVLESMKNPTTSWSHERCIIRLIEALVNQKKRC
ncbi:hypothetical protein IG631_09559 [Alternaria alternata]|nr:hypothetical protein IG631_09559 [Alternaria alternata]